jgi:hypothetical protein
MLPYKATYGFDTNISGNLADKILKKKGIIGNLASQKIKKVLREIKTKSGININILKKILR